MTMRIRTDQVPQTDMVDFMRDAMAKTWMPMDFRPGYPADYFAELRAVGFGPMQAVVMDVLPAEPGLGLLHAAGGRPRWSRAAQKSRVML